MHLVKATAWNWAAEGRWSGEKDIDRVTFLGYFRSSFTSYFFLSLTAFRVVLFFSNSFAPQPLRGRSESNWKYVRALRLDIPVDDAAGEKWQNHRVTIFLHLSGA